MYARLPQRVSLCWALVAMLVISRDVFAADNGLGASVAIAPSGTVMVIGAIRETANSFTDAGLLRVFTLTSGAWSTSAILTASTQVQNSRLGAAVAMTDDTIVAGAPNENLTTGAIYIFTLSQSTWTFAKKFSGDSGSLLGCSVAIHSGVVLAGAKGKSSGVGMVQSYTIKNGAWTSGAVMTTGNASDLIITGKRLATPYNGNLGASISMNSKIIISGAPTEKVDVPEQGAAYLWTRSGVYIDTSGSMVRLTTSDQLGENSHFGAAVATISNTMVAVSCVARNTVYLFTLDFNWSLASSFVAPDGVHSFGTSMSTYYPYLVVGSKGVALKLVIQGNYLAVSSALIPSSPTSGNYGNAVAVSKSTIVVADYTFDSSLNNYYTFDFGSNTKTIPSPLSKSQQMGFQTVFWKGYLIISVPFCVDKVTPGACDGGHLLTYRLSDKNEWKYSGKVRNPYRNRELMFGKIVEATDDYLMVSAPGSNYKVTDIGIIVLFQVDPGTNKIKKGSIIRFRKALFDSNFGSSLAASMTMVAVGTPGYRDTSDSSPVLNAGSVQVFSRNFRLKWGQRKQVTSPTPTANEHFGQSVALGMDMTLAVSNNPVTASLQAVYIFTKNSDGEWVYASIVKDSSKLGFGFRIAILDMLLLYVSAPQDASSAEGAGSISIYDISLGTSNFKYTIQANSGVVNEYFGHSFSTDGTRLVVGANSCGNTPPTKVKGAAYLFTRDNPAGSWVQERRYESIIADGVDGYGHAVAILGDTIVIGAPYSSGDKREGAAYIIRG